LNQGQVYDVEAGSTATNSFDSINAAKNATNGLASGAFTLTSWLFAAFWALFGIVSSIKSMTERLSLAYFRRRRLRREHLRAVALA